jgi:uncharacterized glyoxalase superfamily protein PhnB
MEWRMDVTPHLHYRDPEAARLWLERAFGLETELLVTDADGRVIFARLTGGVGIAPEGAGKSPASLGASTQTVSLRMAESIDDHFARARAGGARILSAPRQEFYGDVSYMAADLEGHIWSFGQRVPDAGGPPPEGWTVRFPNREGAK